MEKHLFPQNVNWYKACLHTHSTVSDGVLTPVEVRDAYKAKGYSILALTDHSVMVEHQNLNQDDFLMVTGVEIDMEQAIGNRGKCRHLCLLSKDPKQQWVPFRDPQPIESSKPYEAVNTFGDLSREFDYDAMNKVIAAANAHGCLVSYNHPAWSLERYPDYAPIEGLWAMEHRNTSGVSHGFPDDAPQVFQDLLCMGKFVMPIMTDDTHSPIAKSGMEILGGSWTMVASESLEYGKVMEALEKGDLYSSCGPEIQDIVVDGDRLTVKCSSARMVQLISPIRWCRAIYSKEGDLTQADFDISVWRKHYEQDENSFLRIVVTAADGSYAVTRAYKAEELRAE